MHMHAKVSAAGLVMLRALRHGPLGMTQLGTISRRALTQGQSGIAWWSRSRTATACSTNSAMTCQAILRPSIYYCATAACCCNTPSRDRSLNEDSTVWHEQVGHKCFM